ncbi:MAG: DEAD/DEAH box helicase [Peptoanaerobacter stomatis]|uniref:DEAD/DEAH box helicase n=1 Tax=Peptoanaerobacter stomatis TaxID=796937 RepID=UPI003F9FC281
MSSFKDLKIKAEFLQALKNMRISEPTPIQQEVIPIMLKKRSIIAKAQTGTGKTLAFLLPIMTMTDEALKLPQALVLSPTRELSNQTKKVFDEVNINNNLSCNNIVGGHDLKKQENKFAQNSQLIVATPGRLLEHIRAGNINMKYIRQLIIDEADQMLEYGFLEDIVLLKDKLPDNLQIVLLSATMPKPIIDLAKKLIKNPVKIDITQENTVTDNIEQLIFKTSEKNKLSTLKFVIEQYNPFMAIIFCNSKKNAEKLYELMGVDGYDCNILYGDFSQKKREFILEQFRKMKFRFLVSTDLSARGFDIDGVTHVINYEIPADHKYYIHRIGRTGRADKNGIAISLIDEKDEKRIEKINQKFKIKTKTFYDRNENERKQLIKKLNI